MILLSARTIELSFQYEDDNSISSNRPKVILSFSVIFCFFKLKLSPIALRLSAEVLSHNGGFPSQSVFLEFVVSLFDSFAEPCARRNTNYPSLWEIKTSFAFSLLGYISDASNFPNLPNPQSQSLLSKFTPRSIQTQER